MMNNKKITGLYAVLLTGMLFLLLALRISVPAYASDGTMNCEIRLLHPTEGVTVDLYEVGTVSASGEITLAENFASYQIDLKDSNAAALLSDYITRDRVEKGLKPLQTKITEKTESADNALAIFEDLQPAVYLLLCSNVTVDHMIFQASPVMLQIPQWKDGTYQNCIEIHAKYDRIPEKKTTDLNVMKVWKDNGSDKHPESIVVQLLKDGVLAEERQDAEVTLNDENNWTYIWKDLDGTAVWTVLEKKVPQGYTVSIVKEKENICITNTGNNPPPSPPPYLPQTGQLWWPVLVLTVGGLFLILIGLLVSRRSV